MLRIVIFIIACLLYTTSLSAVESEDALKKRISQNPNDYAAAAMLGNIYQEKGDKKNALKFFKKAVKIKPDYPDAHFFLGRLYFLTRDYDNAVSELTLFKERMRPLPKMEGERRDAYINSLYYLSEVYFTLKRYEDARKETEEILSLDPNQQDAHHNLGVYYYVYERSRSKAYKSFMKAIELDPTTHTAKTSRYAVEFMRNNPDSRITPDFSFIDQEYRD